MELKELIYFVLSRYGDGELYNSAITKLVYLIDIEFAKRYGKQLTDIQWQRDSYGPFVWDIMDCAGDNPDMFEIREVEGSKRRIRAKEDTETKIVLTKNAMDIVELVIEKYPNPNVNFGAFLKSVYETPPMILSTRNGPLRVVENMIIDKETDELFDELDTPEWNETFDFLAAN
jgi:hypothetical protein